MVVLEPPVWQRAGALGRPPDMVDRVVARILWALGIAAVCIIAFAFAMGIVMAVAGPTASPRGPWVGMLAVWAISAGGTIVLAARAARDDWPSGLIRGIVLLLGAVGTAFAVEVTMMRWAYERFGEQAADPELIGLSSWLSAMVVVVGLSALAAAVLPSAGGAAGRVLTAVASLGVLLVVASNVPGAMDGVTALGVPMGIAMVAAAALAVIAAVVSGVRGRLVR